VIVTTVLVTGGTGFIGQRLLEALKARGEHVRCLVRSTRSLPPGVETIRGDVTSLASLRQAVRGVDIVYHLAGATLVWHPLLYRRVNALGTHHLALACAQADPPPRVVYLSSLAAAGSALSDHLRNENDPPTPVSHYGRSKLAGERALLAVADRVPTTILRGASVFGPGDPNTIRLFKAARLGLNAVPGSADVRLAWIYVDDLVRALLLAAERGARLSPVEFVRGIYFTALDEQPTLAEVGRLAGQAVGNPRVRTVSLPRPLCWFWGHVIDWWVSCTGNPRLLTTDKMRDILAGSWTCQTYKARQELGFSCEVSLAEGFARSVSWYRQHGWL
jgi:nucleoside-diphosphate-sugar epimerase